MSILQRLFGRAERRSADTWSYASPGGWFGRDHHQHHVSVTAAENLATVQACVGVISSTIASLPARVYQVTGDVRTEISGGPYASLIGNPYAVMTWSDWIEFVTGSVLLHGNGLAEIVSDGAGRVVALRPLAWERVTPLRLLNDPAKGRLVFNITMPNEPMRTLLDSEVFFLRDRTDDGLIGRSRISRSPGAVRNAEQLQTFSLAGWENGATPSGTVTFDKKLGKDAFSKLRAQFDSRNTGVENAKRIIYLDVGSEFKPMSVSPEDAQVLESRRFSVEELARLFQVPPPLVQDYTRNTFTNAATAGTWFAQFTLLPWVRKIEAEFKRSVFGMNSGYELELDMSGLTRGDYQTRWASYAVAKGQGILTVDEIRAAEGYGPMPADPMMGHNGGPPIEEPGT